MLRFIFFCCAAFFTLKIAAQTSANLTFADARHLLARTGFSPSITEVSAFEGKTRAEAVTQLLESITPQPLTPLPPWTSSYARVYRPTMSQEDRQAANRVQQEYTNQLRAWWLEEMKNTPTPLRERMVLFWHNHFTSGYDKVRSAFLLHEQNQLFRQHAVGNFEQLLKAVVMHPAMLLYLDQLQSNKNQANENLARELMELFTLGEGNYSEADIKQVARALTGMNWDGERGTYRYRPAQHDDGIKTILGQTKNFDGTQVLSLMAKHPKTAEWMSRKLLMEFLTPEPTGVQVQALAKVWLAHQGEIKPVLYALFTGDDFYAPEHRATLVKSPVELVVGSARQLGIQIESYQPLVVVTRNLGQNLFAPPNVKGWPGHLQWLNSGSLLGRKALMARLIQNDGQELADSEDTQMMQRMNQKVDVRDRRAFAGAMLFDAPQFLASAKPLSQAQWQSLMLAGTPVQSDEHAVSLSGLRSLTLDPAYQLK